MRDLARAGFAVTALATVLLPWYALDDYTPNGWDATTWGKVALIAAVIGLALASADEAPRVRIALAAVAVAAIALRVVVVPDFGFAFDGLDVPTERRVGLPLALAAALLALLAEALQARRAVRPDSPPPGTPAGASASGPSGPAPA